jgi:RNA methyltransferase, TrmH family
VLDGLQDPGNLGTVLRSAGAAGDTAIWLTENSVDFYSPKVVRAGMGAHFRVPAKFDQKWDTLKTQFKAAGVEEVYVADGGSEGESGSTSRPRKADSLPEALYYNIDFKKPCAVIIGNEARGASASAWQSATHRLNIPMPGGAESLNAGVAASLIIFEALRQRSA